MELRLTNMVDIYQPVDYQLDAALKNYFLASYLWEEKGFWLVLCSSYMSMFFYLASKFYQVHQLCQVATL